MPPLDIARVIAPDLFASQKPDMAWADDPSNLAMLLRWLACKGLTINWQDDDYARFMEHGHRWHHEWDEMQAEFARAEEEDGA